MRAALRLTVLALTLAGLASGVVGCGQKGPLMPLRESGARNLPVTTSSPLSPATSSTGMATSPGMSSSSRIGGSASPPSAPASSATP